MIHSSYTSKYLFFSFFCHLVLILFLLSKTEVVDRVKVQNFHEKNGYSEITFLTENPEMQSSAVLKRNKPNQIEVGALGSRTENQDAELLPLTAKQKLDMSTRAIKPNLKISATDNVKSAKTGQFLAITEPNPNKKIEKTKKTAHSEKPVPKISAVEAIRYKKASTSNPEPKRKADLHTKLLGKREEFDPSNTSTLKNPLTVNKQTETPSAAKDETSALIKFNKKYIPKFESQQNTQYSAKKMPKRNKSKKAFPRSHPNVEIMQTKRQCRLIRRQKKNDALNVREIQTQLQSSNITISNILNNSSSLKPNQISIASLLGSNFYIQSQNLGKTKNTIESLLNQHNLRGQFKDLFCEP
jgi:hypothetical protein